VARQTLWDLAAVLPECEYNFCDLARSLRMGENTFCHPCNFKELRVVKGYIFQLVRYVPDGSPCATSAFHVTASNGIVSNSSPYTPLAVMTASSIASVRAFETIAMQMSSRCVWCAPNAVDDRSRDHHAERLSVPGTCFWPLIVR
jgi:hypothetical protein